MNYKEDSPPEPDNDELDREVSGEYNTLRVYLYMLKKRVSSTRDVQRALDFSSPTLAQHHLEKLGKYGLVTKNYDGSYNVKSKSFGILRLYIRSGRWIVPRTIFFVIIFGILTGGFLSLTPMHSFFLIAAILCASGLAVAVYETIRFYKILPQN